MTTADILPKETAEPPETILFNYLRDSLYKPKSAALDIESLPENFRDLGKGLLFYTERVAEAKEFALALSNGNLNAKLPSRGNEIAAPLKGLHASLRHLTWQTGEVAKGDYKQHVDFMGDFANAFNSMVEQLYKNREELLQEIESSKKKSEALAESNNFLEAITAQITQWIIVAGRDSGEWLYENHPWLDILKNPGQEQELRKWIHSRLSVPPASGTMQFEELELSSAEAQQYFSVVIHPIYWYEHEAVAFVLTDVSSEKKRMHRLEDAAYRDPLTKTFNRHYGMEILGEWLAERKSFVICFIDLDNLKYVNDKFGHNEGDKYILQSLDILRKFSDDVIICRLGGDEFMILSPSASLAKSETRLEELRSYLLQTEDDLIGPNIKSLSYGVIQVQDDNIMSASELLGMADEKMYSYKKAHKMTRQSSIAAIEKNDAVENAGPVNA